MQVSNSPGNEQEQQAAGNFLSGLLKAWNDHDKEAILSFYSAAYKGAESSEASELYGPDSVGKMVDKFFTAFPDLQISMVDHIMATDRAAIYWRAEGHHQGMILNIPPTGKKVNVLGVSFFNFKDNQIVSGTHVWDMAGMLRDLGLLPRLT